MECSSSLSGSGNLNNNNFHTQGNLFPCTTRHRNNGIWHTSPLSLSLALSPFFSSFLNQAKIADGNLCSQQKHRMYRIYPGCCTGSSCMDKQTYCIPWNLACSHGLRNSDSLAVEFPKGAIFSTLPSLPFPVQLHEIVQGHNSQLSMLFLPLCVCVCVCVCVCDEMEERFSPNSSHIHMKL